jgi:hypothetical protein
VPTKASGACLLRLLRWLLEAMPRAVAASLHRQQLLCFVARGSGGAVLRMLCAGVRRHLPACHFLNRAS